MFIMIALAFPLYGLVDKSSTDLTRALLGEHHLTLDTYEGSAWIALIPFTMWGIRPSFLPPVPWLSVSPDQPLHDCCVKVSIDPFLKEECNS
jgi:hypothetical protein